MFDSSNGWNRVFLRVVSKNDKGFQNGAFCTNIFISQSQLAALSLSLLSSTHTKVPRLRKRANSDLLPVHGITKPGFTCHQRANTFGNVQEIKDFWLGESKQPLRKERNHFPSLCCNGGVAHGAAIWSIRSIHRLRDEHHACR